MSPTSAIGARPSNACTTIRPPRLGVAGPRPRSRLPGGASSASSSRPRRCGTPWCVCAARSPRCVPSTWIKTPILPKVACADSGARASMQLFNPDDVATLRPWLTDHVCRYWLARIHGPAGGFFGNLDALGAPVANQRRTTLVQARLTYVFSHAYLLSGGDPVFREAARHGLAFLVRAARGPDGGWFRAVSVDGATLDNTRDAYDHAFVLFALAWYCRATGDRNVIQLADATWEFMQQRLADPQHCGFFEEFAPGRTGIKLPRRQNPHMHLLEAVLALHVATGEKNWLRRATAL